MNRQSDSELRRGFSLLEVIIATGILAASAVLLLSLFSTGERHAVKAESRVFAQMLCQSKLDELLADPSQLRSVDDEPFKGYAKWSYSVEWTPTDIEGLVRLRVSVAEVEEFDQLENSNAAIDRQTFELVRWTRHASNLGFPSDRSGDTTTSPTLP